MTMPAQRQANGEDHDVQVPEQWSPGESQRAIQRLADAIEALTRQVAGLPGQWQADLREMRTELRGDYVRRDVYDERARTNDEWRRRVDVRLHELEDDAERLREEQAKHIEQANKDAANYPTKDDLSKARTQLWTVLGVLGAAVIPVLLFTLDKLTA